MTTQITDQPSDQKTEKTRLTSLSPSRAGDFKTCPQLFKFRAIDKIPSPPTVYQARGTTVHLALERLFELPAAERTPERLYDLFRTSWQELKPGEFAELFADEAEERAWGIESLEILSRYFALEDPTHLEPLAREMDMTETIGHMKIRGILDRMEEGPDGLVITDYKTGKAPPERYAISAFFALKIYALLIRIREGVTPVALKLMYLGGDKGPTIYEIAVNDTQLDAMERHLDALWATIDRAIERETFPPRPGPLCNWCSYQDICPAFADDVEGSTID